MHFSNLAMFLLIGLFMISGFSMLSARLKSLKSVVVEDNVKPGGGGGLEAVVVKFPPFDLE